MKFLLSLAWKNLSRYRKRTIITASAIAVGLAVYLLSDSLLLGAEIDSERNLIWYESSSARILASGYWEERNQLPLKYTIEGPRLVLDELAARGIAATPRVVFQGELIVREDPYPQDGSMRIKVFGIDPERDDRVFRFRETITDRRYLQPGEEGVLLGSWLAEHLGAKVGFPVTIVARTRGGFYQTIDLPIVGIVSCPNPTVNRASVFIPLESADFYLEMEGGVTEIDVSLPLRDDADRWATEIAAVVRRFGDLEVLSWRKPAADYVALAESKRQGSGIILLLGFVIAAVGVSNTMLMAVLERVRELGTMRAMGMGDRQIRVVFLLEAGGIGLIGSLLGVALGTPLVAWLVRTGIDYSSITRQMDVGYRIAGAFRGAWHPEAMVQAVVFGVLMSVAVAFIPTRRALKMQITDCLRHE